MTRTRRPWKLVKVSCGCGWVGRRYDKPGTEVLRKCPRCGGKVRAGY